MLLTIHKIPPRHFLQFRIHRQINAGLTSLHRRLKEPFNNQRHKPTQRYRYVPPDARIDHTGMEAIRRDSRTFQTARQFTRKANIGVFRDVVEIDGEVSVGGVETVQIERSETIKFGGNNYDSAGG